MMAVKIFSSEKRVSPNAAKPIVQEMKANSVQRLKWPKKPSNDRIGGTAQR